MTQHPHSHNVIMLPTRATLSTEHPLSKPLLLYCHGCVCVFMFNTCDIRLAVEWYPREEKRERDLIVNTTIYLESACT